jgi:hypothetical protein
VPRSRALPPSASDEDRIAAARLAAQSLLLDLQIGELIRALWSDRPLPWKHYRGEGEGAISERT